MAAGRHRSVSQGRRASAEGEVFIAGEVFFRLRSAVHPYSMVRVGKREVSRKTLRRDFSRKTNQIRESPGDALNNAIQGNRDIGTMDILVVENVP